jgi:hypothetical protein
MSVSNVQAFPRSGECQILANSSTSNPSIRNEIEHIRQQNLSRNAKKALIELFLHTFPLPVPFGGPILWPLIARQILW